MRPIPRHVLVPVDGSLHSMHAVAYAGRLASSVGARLTVLYVVLATSSEAMGMRGLERADIDAKLHAAAAPVFARADAQLDTVADLSTHGEVVRFGQPAAEIITAVGQLDVDLIVMGSRGLSPLKELLLGSVSEKVLRRAACPVMVVR